jgi:hypothetical protein
MAIIVPIPSFTSAANQTRTVVVLGCAYAGKSEAGLRIQCLTVHMAQGTELLNRSSHRFRPAGEWLSLNATREASFCYPCDGG